MKSPNEMNIPELKDALAESLAERDPLAKPILDCHGNPTTIRIGGIAIAYLRADGVPAVDMTDQDSGQKITLVFDGEAWRIQPQIEA